MGFCALGQPASGILGDAPHYGPAQVSRISNTGAIIKRIWSPGLDAGYDPQGLALAQGSLLIAAYRSDRVRVARGPCRVFRLDPVTGRQTGSLDVPDPCGHAGGLAYDGTGMLYIVDTGTLFRVALDGAFGASRPAIIAHPLGPGLTGALATAAADALWIGTYNPDADGRIYAFSFARLQRLKPGEMLTTDMAARTLAIPSYAQGAAFDRGGKLLWISRSSLDWATVDVLDAATGALVRRYPMPGGLEGIAFDGAGHLWGVSESGARHIYNFPLSSLLSPFNPLVFEFDPARLDPN